MDRPVPTFEKWVWTELLAFDAEREDFGVSAYLETLGFVPDGLSLLISSPDFILRHEGVGEDAVLSPQFCSRNGHEGNETRRRQVWTRHQLRNLIRGLQAAGCRVYLSNFTKYLKDRFHREWLTDHPECMVNWATHGPREALFVLTRLKDGTYLQDLFASQLARVCEDYGFDGWHGPDGYGPLTALYVTDYSDDFIAQFVARGDWDLPAELRAPSENLPKNLIRRRDWLLRHRRAEWTAFWTDRWAEFWKIVTGSLHGIGRKTMINSAWTRDPFEAIFRYGVDYRKIAASGVDAIMVETAAGGILLGSEDRDYHYDYLAMLLHVSACVPDTKLIFLHNTKDVVENWDLLRHAPPMLEREVYALSNVFLADDAGHPRRCVQGLLACLGDGISPSEWKWLEKQWELGFSDLPERVLGATLVWADSLLDGHLSEYAAQRDPSAHWLTYRLMERNAPIQMAARIRSVAAFTGPLLVLNPQYLKPEEKQVLWDSGRPIIAIGPDFRAWPDPDFAFRDRVAGRPLECRVYHAGRALPIPEIEEAETAEFPADLVGLPEPLKFREELYFRPVSESFLRGCAETIRAVSGAFSIEPDVAVNLVAQPPVRAGVMLTEAEDGSVRLAVKNSATVYGRFKLHLTGDIQSVRVLSDFPVTPIRPEAGTFSVIVPPRGIVVAEVRERTAVADSEASLAS